MVFAKVTASFNKSSHIYICKVKNWVALTARTFSECVRGRTGQQTIPNTLTTAEECSAIIPE